jgi:hypothetical protein
VRVVKRTDPFILTDAEGNTGRPHEPGVIHVGEIAHYIWTVGLGNKLGDYGEMDDASKRRAARGFIFEIGIEEYYKRRKRFADEEINIQVPLELEHPDGFIVRGTPDAIVTPNDESLPPYLEQWKATAKSIPPEEEFHNKFAMWLLSDKTYCYMLSTALGQPRCTCRYVICSFAQSSFNEPIQSFDVTFDMTELEEHWGMMEQAARELKRRKDEAEDI